VKRRAFLQLVGLTAAPIPALVGADLGKALTETEEPLLVSGEGGTALVKVTTSIKPFFFQIPVVYRTDSSMVTCHPTARSVDIEVVEGLTAEGMLVEKVQVRTHGDLAKFYKTLGMERGWMDLPITPIRCSPGDAVTICFAKSGLYSIC